MVVLIAGAGIYSMLYFVTYCVSAGDLPASVIPHVRSLIASQTGSSPSSAALHDTTALHTVTQISARSTDAGFLAGGIFALAAVVLARAAINVKRPEAQPPRD